MITDREESRALEALAPGAELPVYEAFATMPADPSENKVHEDGVAQALGFRGALVPGVTVYAWMTHPVVAALGPAWLERGTFSVRFAKPVYFGERATIRATVADRTDETVSIAVRALDAAGATCATATMALSPGGPVPAPAGDAYPAAPLPAERPLVSRDVLAARTVLGTPELALDDAAARAFIERVRETLPRYAAGAGSPAHPGIYLDLANRALSRNVRVSPWIHVESQGRHLGPARVGERLEMRAKVAGLFEKKGNEFVELDLLLLAEGSRPVASIRHVAIYRPRGA